jgi:hypothetical protein
MLLRETLEDAGVSEADVSAVLGVVASMEADVVTAPATENAA